MRFMKFIAAFIVIFMVSCASVPKDPMAMSPEEIYAMAEQEMTKKNYAEAREHFKTLKIRDVEKKYYAIAQIRTGDAFFAEESYPEAAAEYDAFLSIHTYHDEAPYSRYRLALCYQKQIDSVDRSYENILNARREFARLMKDFPRNPYRESAMAGIARCDNQIASYEDYVGSFYLKKGSYKAAIGRYETLLAAYPGAGVETDVLLKLGQAYKEIGESGKARDILSGLIARYPSSRQAEQARDILGSP